MDEALTADLTRPAALNPEALGFMCGLEVHQQLATGKLHSRQPGVLYDVTIDTVPDAWPRFARKLRAARGEGGAVDVAARFEVKRNRSFVYVQTPNAGLVELDEQPPVAMDADDWLNYSWIFLTVRSLIILGLPHKDVANSLM